MAFLLAIMVFAPSASAMDKKLLRRLNDSLTGHVLDFSHNHGRDNRVFSQILGKKRDLYVYLPPGYDRNKEYSVILWLHGAFGDERAFLAFSDLVFLDTLIRHGHFPPVILACPDGVYNGTSQIAAQHSFYVNGLGGRYEDHLIEEVLPFLAENFSIRCDRQGHVLIGISAGGLGALNLAMKHRDQFRTVAVMGAPANLRYFSEFGYLADFSPNTFRWNEVYNPKQVTGVFLNGWLRIRAKLLIERAFGPREDVLENVKAANPADLLETTALKPRELDIFMHYPGEDNFNFDAHAQSFAFLAARQGVDITLEKAPGSQHVVAYFQSYIRNVYFWLSSRVPPPIEKTKAIQE